MKLFRLFSSHKAASVSTADSKSSRGEEQEEIEETVSNCGASTTSLSISSACSKRSSKKSQRSKKPKNRGEEVLPTKSENLKVVERFMELTNLFDPENIDSSFEETLGLFESPDVTMEFEDGLKCTARECALQLKMAYESFPDYGMSLAAICEDPRSPKRIFVDGVCWSGTHTGTPYTIIPGELPAIPPSGKRISLDEERYIFHMKKGGKIGKIQIIAMGSITGYAGLYESAEAASCPKLSE
ncbi:expressed unknown protein [Seminavis robusta]|uniref:Uncharacterized protein n=1 Tax=Seminavis robusta TaxID=568900 RepID=A0A9N8DJ52_9STRA|nr:expressed unknown protein [Seminavis robusta]|eukprot:Sro181_g078950.1 n/a (242) ;mRNA; r:6858-7583